MNRLHKIQVFEQSIFLRSADVPVRMKSINLTFINTPTKKSKLSGGITMKDNGKNYNNDFHQEKNQGRRFLTPLLIALGILILAIPLWHVFITKGSLSFFPGKNSSNSSQMQTIGTTNETGKSSKTTPSRSSNGQNTNRNTSSNYKLVSTKSSTTYTFREGYPVITRTHIRKVEKYNSKGSN